MAKAITVTHVISASIECPHELPDRDVKLLFSTSSVRRLEHYSYDYSVSVCTLRVCAHVNTFPLLGEDARSYAAGYDAYVSAGGLINDNFITTKQPQCNGEGRHEKGYPLIG
jgi:hypothetical protein